MLMGRIYWKRQDGNGTAVFRLSARNEVRFRVVEPNILVVALTLSNPAGDVVVQMRDNHLTHETCQGLSLDSRPGRLRVTVPATNDFVSAAMINRYESSNPPAALVKEGRVTLLDIQVLDLGTVQVDGMWAEGERGVVANADFLSICQPGGGFVHISGYGEKRHDKDLANLPIMEFVGSLDESVLSAAIRSRGF